MNLDQKYPHFGGSTYLAYLGWQKADRSQPGIWGWWLLTPAGMMISLDAFWISLGVVR